MANFDDILQKNACHIILPLACITAFLDGRVFAEHYFSRLWSVSENVQTLELHGIFGSDLHIYFFNIVHLFQ